MSTHGQKPPNVLFFLSDQHAASYLGCNGNRLIRTPHLDRLASEGAYFENAYCQNPLCTPSRASLLTGLYSRNLGIYENRHILESNIETLPRVLGRAGYRTCLIGKAHVNGEQFHGYQQRPYGDLYGQGHQPEYIRTGKEASESGLEDILTNTGPTAIPLPMTQTEICVAETVKWLGRHADRGGDAPFFLSVNFDKPHFPYRPPAPYFEHYAGQVSLPEYPPDYANTLAVPFVRTSFIANGGWKHYGKDRDVHLRALASYCGCVEWIDDAMGRILASLSYLGLDRDTIVIYSTDHGEMAGEKGAWQKSVFFDPSSKVPLIVKWPGAPQGIRRKELVGLVDLFPTICAAADARSPERLDGRNLDPLLLGNGTWDRDHIFCESTVLKVPEHSGCMIRTARFKYCLYLDGNSELYDMETDPREESNLSGRAEYAGIESELKERVKSFWEPEKQMDRYLQSPRMKREKHFYLYSNQFVDSDGTVTNARP